MEKWEGTFPRLWFAVATISISIFWPISLQAQRALQRPGFGEASDDDAGPGSFAAPNRNTLQTLNQAQKVLKEHRYGEALEGLSQILRDDEDFFFQPDRKAPIYRSLKAEAQQLLGQMPKEGRDLYEVRCGAEAREKLKRAVAAGDYTALSDISAQLFHTQAGYEATYLLALYHMDHGAPLAGALTLKRLHEAAPATDSFEPGLSLAQAACYYQAGMPGDCRQVLIDLKRRLGKPALQLAGREVLWFDNDGDAPEWLAKLTGLERMAAAVETGRWAMFCGDPARNASSVGGAPLLNLRWRIPVTDDPALEKGLLEQQTSYREHGVALFAGLHPLAVGDTILLRTAKNVLAIDFNTGKRLWPTATEEDPVAEPRFNRFNGMMGTRSMDQKQQYGQRVWDDAAYGTLSSDGSRVFVLEELPLGVTGPNGGFIMMGNGRNDPSNRSITDKLAAYDIRTGKLQWELGGKDALPQSDTFFLGPPLPLRGELYVMAEIKDEMRLLALDSATGKQLWSQQLAMVESNITQDPFRRLAGVSPSYSDGILICPTGSGCVVAVDLATRSLLWGYIYDHPNDTNMGMGRRMRGINVMQNAFNNSNGAPVPRWLDGTATIVSGRVLLTPAEADAIYCLNLADGKRLWSQPRGDHYYVGCVHNGAVVLVGRNSIDAVNLEDGSKAWGGRPITLSSGAGVCGHGFYAGSQYFVPLSSGEVMTVDLETGKVVATAKSRRSSTPGNLISYRGRVISQGFDGLELYYQVDAAREEVARRLTANPEDVEGLTLRGEMLLDAGKSTAAVADFRRAYDLDSKSESHARTRELLRDALLAGLRDDFAAHRSMAAEVEQLLDDPVQRAVYFRCMATGLQRTGDWTQAVAYLMKLVDLEDARPALEKVDRSHLVRRDCWVQARLGLLRSEGGAEAVKAIDGALAPRLKDAEKDKSFDGLKRFLAFFGNQPSAAAAREELLKRLTQAGRIMEAELLMAAAVDSTDHKAQAALLADMAELNFRASRAGDGGTSAARLSDAAACFRQLQRQFADVPCHAGLTPNQWLAIFPDGDALRREVHLSEPSWPVGEVEATKPDANENPYIRGPRFDLAMSGPSGPFYADYTVSLEGNQQEVSLRDGLGHLQKPVRLSERGRLFVGGMYNQYSSLARCCGHLLVISMGNNICALDPWNASGNSSPILWRHDLTSDSGDSGVNMAFINNNIDREQRANPFGPVNARYICFQRRRSIVAIDPASGDRLWERQDIAPRSEVFGDDQYMIVLPPEGSEASVYRASDGELLGTRKVPRPPRSEDNMYYDPNERSANAVLSTLGFDFFGRNVLTWKQGDDNNGRVLDLFDPWLQKSVWPSRTFLSGAKVSVIGSEAVGVLEPGGHFVLIDLADGHTIADLMLELRQHFPVTELVVTRLGDQYFILAHDNRPLGNGNEEQGFQAPQGMFCYPVRRSRIYALDLKGKLAWSAPADVDHQQFLLDQPGRMPVLVFVVFRSDMRAGGQTMHTSIVAIDRRNGRIVYDNDFPGPTRWPGVEFHADPETKTVRIATNNENVSLNFTDKPVRSTVRHSLGVKKPHGKLGEALLDAMGVRQ